MGKRLHCVFHRKEWGRGLPWWLRGKESACNEGNQHLIPGREDRLEEGMATHSDTLA